VSLLRLRCGAALLRRAVGTGKKPQTIGPRCCLRRRKAHTRLEPRLEWGLRGAAFVSRPCLPRQDGVPAPLAGARIKGVRFHAFAQPVLPHNSGRDVVLFQRLFSPLLLLSAALLSPALLPVVFLLSSLTSAPNGCPARSSSREPYAHASEQGLLSRGHPVL
jgi:hypothetical protein